MNTTWRSLFGLLLVLPILLFVWGRVDGSAANLASVFDGAAVFRLTNSIQLAFGASVLAVFFALPVFFAHSFFLHSKRVWLQAVALLPFSVPPFAMASAWMTLAGWVENPNGRIVWGAQSVWEQWLYSVPGAAFVLALCFWPIVFFYLVLSGVPARREHEAALIYMKPMQRLVRFWLPTLWRPLFISGFFVFGVSLLQFEAPSLLTVDVYPLEIYVQFSALLNEGNAILLSLPYLLLAPAAAWIFFADPKQGAFGASELVFIRPNRLSALGVIGLACVVFALSVFAPAGSLMLHAGSVGFVAAEWLRQSETIVLSVFYAAISSILMFACGLWLCRSTKPNELFVWLVVGLACFVLPGVLISASWLEFRSYWPGWLPHWAQIITLIAGYTVHFWVIGLAAALIFWDRYGRRQQEAESLLPLSAIKRIRFFYMPAWLKYCPPILFVMALVVWADAAVTTLLHPPGGETLTIRYFNLLHYGSEPRTAAVGLLLLLTPMVLLLAGAFMRYAALGWRTRHE